MGVYSWKFADFDNKDRLILDNKGYVICPDDSAICERNYEGYGMFGGYDIYELVAEWNRESILSRAGVMLKAEDEKLFAIAKVYSTTANEKEAQEKAQKLAVKLNKHYWKRDLGVYLAAEDEDNERLIYPIKITKNSNAHYADLPASKSDEMQGCY